MVAAKDNLPRFTPEEYFAWEEQQIERHEYVDGEVYAMSGGTINHSKIASNFNFIFKNHLRGSKCQILTSDARVNIHQSDDYVYPDVSVTCDSRDRETPQYISYPCLIVEVLSDTTEAYDRGKKFVKYRQNSCLCDYLLVSSKEIAIDIYRKNEQGDWIILNYRAGDIVQLRSIDLQFAIEQVYEDIDFSLEIPPGVQSSLLGKQ
jgi:Uma2 family endonuclease